MTQKNLSFCITSHDNNRDDIYFSDLRYKKCNYVKKELTVSMAH